MSKYFVVKEHEIVGAIDTDDPGTMAFPLLAGAEKLSVMRVIHLIALQTRGEFTPRESLWNLGFWSPLLTTLYGTVPDPTNAQLWNYLYGELGSS